MDESLSTREIGWVLDRSPNAVRSMIRNGALQATRVPAGFRIGRDEVLRVARERIEREAGRTLHDRELERLIDDVITTNEAGT
jgi:hypothetical protein